MLAEGMGHLGLGPWGLAGVGQSGARLCGEAGQAGVGVGRGRGGVWGSWGGLGQALKLPSQVCLSKTTGFTFP